MLKGHADILLTDPSTGEVTDERHQDNLVTNAVQDLISMNPAGMGWLASTFNSGFRMLPICPNAIGGVLLFPSAIAEDATSYYAPSANVPTGYASNLANTTADPKRGGLNADESHATSDGYRLVFDFATSQANGPISSVCLTSSQGGVCYMGSEYDYHYLTQVSTAGSTDTSYTRYAMGSVEGTVFGARVIGSTEIDVYTWPMSFSTLPLSQTPAIETPTVARVTTSHDFSGSPLVLNDSTIRAASVRYLDPKTVWYCTIEGGRASETSVTYPDVSLAYQTGSYGATFHDGYCHMLSSDLMSVYKLSMTDPADVRQIPLPAKYSTGNLSFGQIVDPYQDGTIIGTNFVMQNDVATKRCFGYAIPIGQTLGKRYGPYYINYGYNQTYLSVANAYLATIDNIPTITKTADRTMKIIYTLTEAS